MNLSLKIHTLQFIQAKIDAANDYISDLEWLATELECPASFPYNLEARRQRAEDVIVGCSDTCTCTCPLCVADRAIRDEFRSAPPDEFYALERRYQAVSKRLRAALWQER
jgi:hypothetical protein